MSTLHFLLYSNYIQHFIFIAIQYIHKVELWRNNIYEISLGKKTHKTYTVTVKYINLHFHETWTLWLTFK